MSNFYSSQSCNRQSSQRHIGGGLVLEKRKSMLKLKLERLKYRNVSVQHDGELIGKC
jgi:hypothetical protein